MPEAERYGCGKRTWGVAVTRRGGTLLLVALIAIALAVLASLLARA